MEHHFQWRYTLYFTGFTLLCLILIVGPTYFLISQNYNLFYELAYPNSVKLLDHLEREQMRVYTCLLIVGVLLLVLSRIISLRMTKTTVAPMIYLQKNIEQMVRGHGFIPEMEIKGSDEFREIVESYNSFYSSLRQGLKRDLQRLQSLKPAESNHSETYKNWKAMVTEKEIQLGQQGIDPSTPPPAHSIPAPHPGPRPTHPSLRTTNPLPSLWNTLPNSPPTSLSDEDDAASPDSPDVS